ncbi:hypothetical protein [uncultured Aquimarina sp.]|nr:hypothetical protein [uncultured Aquimarina sp.]
MLEVLKRMENVKVIEKSQLKTIRGAAVPCHRLDGSSTNVHCSEY